MPPKPKFQEMVIPRRARKPDWDRTTFYDRPDQVKPWLDSAFEAVLAKNPTWRLKGIPAGFWPQKFFVINDAPGKFKVYGATLNSPKAKIEWHSPWSNTVWSMYLDVKKIEYDPDPPTKNN